MTRRQRNTPEGHTLYWVYVYTKNDGYNFTTTTSLTEAKKSLVDLMKDFGVLEDSSNLDMAMISYGNADGPLVNIDPVKTVYGVR